MLQQLLATIRSWMQTHVFLNETVFLGIFGAAVIVLIVFHLLKPPRT